jgi:hypothetical protein
MGICVILCRLVLSVLLVAYIRDLTSFDDVRIFRSEDGCQNILHFAVMMKEQINL